MARSQEVSHRGEIRMNRSAQAASRRSLAVELAIATTALLIITHVLYIARGVEFIGSHLTYFVAYLLIGTPIIILWIRKRPLNFFSFGLKDVFKSISVFAVSALIIFPPFLAAAHFWQQIVMGKQFFSFAGFPDFGNALLIQLLIIALPEEFYFRGYFQSAMNAIFPKQKRFLGASLGWGWLITAFIFAIAHSIVTYQWWHIFIFFPALVFGYLRERTGLILAPTLFHAASNLLMNWFVRCYG
jgi:membrane protease YdiL (CAAX protease family)